MSILTIFFYCMNAILACLEFLPVKTGKICRSGTAVVELSLSLDDNMQFIEIGLP